MGSSTLLWNILSMYVILYGRTTLADPQSHNRSSLKVSVVSKADYHYSSEYTADDSYQIDDHNQIDNVNSSKMTIRVALAGVYRQWIYGPPLQLFNQGSAFFIAVNDVNQHDVLKNITLVPSLFYTDCDPRKSVSTLVSMIQDHNIDAVIGAACSDATVSLAYLAAAWNVPVVGYTGTSETLADKNIFNTFMRTLESVGKYASPIGHILARFRWKHIGLLYMEDVAHFKHFEVAAQDIFPEKNISIVAREYFKSPKVGEELTDESKRNVYPALKRLAEKSRGEMCIASVSSLRNYLCYLNKKRFL